MLPRRRFHPAEHFSVGIAMPVSHALACGEMIFVGGQVDLDEAAEVTRPGDLVAQTRIAMSRIALLLEGQGADVADLVFLRAFYVLREATDEAALLRDIASYLPVSGRPGPSITMIPLAGLAFEGMEIEIEAIAMRGQNGARLARAAAWIDDGDPLPPVFSQALRVGEMIFTSAQTARAADGGVPFAEAARPPEPHRPGQTEPALGPARRGPGRCRQDQRLQCGTRPDGGLERGGADPGQLFFPNPGRPPPA